MQVLRIVTPTPTKASISSISTTIVAHRLLRQHTMQQHSTTCRNDCRNGYRYSCTTPWIRDVITTMTTAGSRSRDHKQLYSFSSLYSLRSSPQRMYLSSSSSSSPPPPTAAIGVLGTIFFGSLCIGTFLLGTWQTKRYFEKATLVQQRSLDLQSKPLTYEEYCNGIQQQQEDGANSSNITTSTTTTPASFRKIQLHGRYHHDYEILVGPRGPPPGSTTEGGGMASSPQGYYIITPMELLKRDETNHNNQKESQYVLINRGWVPRHMVMGSSSTNQLHSRSSTSSSYDTKVTKEFLWDRPMGLTSVTVVPTQGEGTYGLMNLFFFCYFTSTLYFVYFDHC